MRAFSIVLVVALASSAPLSAQTQAQCDAAADSVVGKPLPNVKSLTWAYWGRLTRCGATGLNAIASHLATAVFAAESNDDRIGSFFSTVMGIRSGQMYAAYTTLAQNAAATKPIRVGAIEALGTIVTPGSGFNPKDFKHPFPLICGPGQGVIRALGDSTSLPANYRATAAATMESIEEDQSSPAQVRGAAHCFFIGIASRLPFNPAKLKLFYVCGNKFRIRNQNPVEATVYFTVGKDTATHHVLVGPLAENSPLTVSNDGKLRIFYNGQEVDSKANGNTPCP